jgi:hypothetical protein
LRPFWEQLNNQIKDYYYKNNLPDSDEVKLSLVKQILNSREFSLTVNVPHYFNNKHLEDNLDLIETAICAFKLNLLNVKDIRAISNSFDLIVKQYVENMIVFDSEKAI